LKQLIIIPNDGFKDASYKNWLILKIFYKKRFTALAKLRKKRLRATAFRIFSLQSTEATQNYFWFIYEIECMHICYKINLVNTFLLSTRNRR